MKQHTLNPTVRNSVALLQNQQDALRKHLKIGERGEVLFRADLSYGDDEVVLVEADGFGGGILLVVEGNYPADFYTHEERAFSTEAEAVQAAAALKHELSANES